MNKKKTSILAVVLAFAIIFTGAFAFFSDSSMFDDSAKVGTFDIEVTFPDDYGVDSLNGQTVTFNITINGVYE